MSNPPLNIIMMGASGAVGTEVVRTLCKMPELQQLTLLGRRAPTFSFHDHADHNARETDNTHRMISHAIDIFNAASYSALLPGHTSAVCTLGVGQPSKMTRAEFVRIDKDAVLAFAQACKQAGVRHFELLGSVGADSSSRYFYLRMKGELEDGLKSLNFERLSLFQPSMILTPTNRYGMQQALTLALWPLLSHLMLGSWRKYRGIPVATLGMAMARNLVTAGTGVETLQWGEFEALAKSPLAMQSN